MPSTWILLTCLLPLVQQSATKGKSPPKQDQRPVIPTDKRSGRRMRVSLADCLLLGDRENIDVALTRLSELAAREDVGAADGVFEPEAFATAEWRRTKSPPRNAFQPSTTSRVYSGSFGLRKRVITGGTLELAFTPSYVDQRVASAFAFPRTFFQGSMTFTLSQPLLRGAWIDYNLADWEAAKAELRARRGDHERARQDVLEATTRAYYDLVFAREDYVVRYQSLELTREQLRNTERRIRLGDLAPRDRVADQAEVAKKEEELITAEQVILDAEDELRRLILPFVKDDAWQLVVVPTEQLGTADPKLTVPAFKESIRTARERRPDLRAARERIEVARKGLTKADRDLLPGLDFTAIYSASGQRDTGRDLANDILESEFPTYTLRLGLSLPIGNLTARSRYNRARFDLETAVRRLQILRVDIAKDLRVALRRLRTLAETIAAARESERLARDNLDRERTRLRLGTQTQFEVQKVAQELQDARSRLLRARLDYRVAWFRLLSIQGTLDARSKLSGSPAPEEGREP